MAKRIDTTSSDGEGFVAELSLEEESVPTLELRGRIDSGSLENCHKQQGHPRRLEHESFLKVLFAILESMAVARHRNNEPGCKEDKIDDECTLGLEVRFNGQVARLVTRIQLAKV